MLAIGFKAQRRNDSPTKNPCRGIFAKENIVPWGPYMGLSKSNTKS
jgi:hypothetical protein